MIIIDRRTEYYDRYRQYRKCNKITKNKKIIAKPVIFLQVFSMCVFFTYLFLVLGFILCQSA